MKEKKKKVSVIVPVYNTEKYLRKCLDSLVNQTLKDIEILVINDGSPDDSQTIIDEYKSKYSNLKSYPKENGGLSDARNYGIDKANGEYLAFVDSDDYIALETYEIMYNKAVSQNFDIVVCDLNYVYEENKRVKASSNIVADTTDIKKAMLNIYPAVWNKIYKKELFQNNLRFKKGIWFEDVEFTYRLLPYVKSIGRTEGCFYQYVQREGSITKKNDLRIYNYIDNLNSVVKFYKDNDFYNEYQQELEYSYVRYLYATFIKQATCFEKEEYQKAVNKACENVKKNFPQYKKNKYFYKSLKGLYLIFFSNKLAELIYSKYHQ